MTKPRAIFLLLLPLVALFVVAPGANAAVTCPNPIPVVNENNCMGPGSTAWQLTNYDQDQITGYAAESSVNLGQSVHLRIAVPGSEGHADVTVFRMGWYGGTGGRLVYQVNNVAVTNSRNCEEPDFLTGFWSCANWDNTVTVPGSALPASGVYLARIRDRQTGNDNQIIFTVRDDSRHSELLYKLPTATYQAYNNFNGHSLYTFNSAGFQTITGVPRAVKVSFERPYSNTYNEANWLPKADLPMIEWLEREGYDVDYTESTSVDANPSQLLNHKTLVISGHDEYWSGPEMAGYKAARDAGVNIASFSGNTAFWKVRFEDGGRTLVCYKSVEGLGPSSEGGKVDGSAGVNDWGPDGIKGTADDALGLDGIAGTSDDKPQNATTTWRDNGAPPGNPNAPPQGRVGPDQPENSLLGSMFLGGNANFDYPLTIPATNDNDEFAGDRIWRNTGISQTSSTTINSDQTGWEWDTIPTQAQYASREPAGVKRLTSTDVGTAPSAPDFLQDEGLMYANVPPPGQPSTISAVKYTAPSGALVFSAGTIQWSWGLAPHYLDHPSGETYEDPPVDSSDPRIQQATYNIFADMGVQPKTPIGIVVDGNDPPEASFTASPNPVEKGASVSFNASGSKDLDGTIVKYEWDLDGNGSYETNTGSNASASRTYASAGSLTVGLRVTDSGGATDVATRTLTVTNGPPGNSPPQASFTASPNPAPVGGSVTFNAAGSSDPDGTIVKYEWDLDGNGSYETDTGTVPSATHTYPTEGDHQIGLRVTDDDGATDQTTRALIVGNGGTYSSRVLATPGLAHYWRLGENSGTTFADSVGTSPATALNGVTFGLPSLLTSEDGNLSASFDGENDAASAPLNLSGTSQLTIEFWLNWSAYANDDDLAFEFTPNFNNSNGGFLIDPNAGEQGGQFAVGIGGVSNRNNAYFQRPSAGAWHHYAFVFNSQAPAAQQVLPYVDGHAVPFEKLASGTGAGNFANSTLYFMSRGGSSLFGKGGLDEVAIYERALSGAEIALQFNPSPTQPPLASFTTSPNPAPTGSEVKFDASGSSDSDGQVVKYEWDLDGNGSYETNTGSNPNAATSFSTAGAHQVGLRVTDDGGATATTTRTVTVQDRVPQASFTISPNPVPIGGSVTFNASGSSDPDGTIVKYEWDLDGNGSYETDTGAVPGASSSFGAEGDHPVGLRVTDDGGATATATKTVAVVGSYGAAVSATPGLIDYWRLGEKAGTNFADSVGGHDATAQGGVAFGTEGAFGPAYDTGASFDGENDAASAPLNLSGTSQLTVEFWLNWSAYANDDDLAFEFTPNFNNNNGGFLIDPNAGELGGQFAVGIGGVSSRNNAYFQRPSAGTWHHYAFVLDSQAPAAQQVLPYVDGKAVPFSKLASGTGAGNFASSILYFMSRGGSSLFGKGGLDEVALYNRALGGAEIAAHYQARGVNKAPQASFTASPNPVPTGTEVSFDASGSSDPDGTVAKYEWDLDGNGSYETDTGSNPNAATSFSTAGDHQVGLRVTDDDGAPATAARTVNVQDRAPVASFTASPNPVPTGTEVSFDASGSSDPDGTVAKYEWDLDGNGSYETDTGSNPNAAETYFSPETLTIGLRVTDDGGASATTTRTLSVVGSYKAAVSQTAGLIDYWQLGEQSGTTLADNVGGHNATALGGVTLASPGALQSEPGTAASFDGIDDSASAPLDLSGTSQLTLEFWLNWSAYANDDDLAFEFTPNFNNSNGGFLIDPNAGEQGGQFAVGIGRGGSRNNVYFERPSAGAWHHYAFVLDTQAPADQQVLPYVDGKAVPFSKLASGTGAGNFANSILYFMSRGGSSLFGKGGLDEVALYNRALGGAEISAQYEAGLADEPPQAAFTATPNPVPTGTQVSFNASGSSDPDGTVARYQWDLDGNGSYETNTKSTPTASRTYGSPGDVTVGLRVTDNEGGAATTTRTVTVQNRAPTASFTATPNPVPTGTQVSFDASGSSDPDGTVAKYEWDLDGNGSHETDTGSTPTTSVSFATPGDHQVGLRVTDNEGASETTTRAIVVQNRAPLASLTASPNPVPTGTEVSFDGSGSSDPDGTVAKYEWDLDGNGSYETDTEATATASKTYASAGPVTVGLRVTDNEGANGTTTRSLVVQNRAPTASFTATPNPVPTGTQVSFDASGSSDPDGTVAKYEWDLDGNGSYETDTGSTPTTSVSFATPGDHQVGLRVTDNEGGTGTTTQAVTAQNRAPQASFTATPNPVPTGTQVSFDGSGSSDPDGTVAKYEWDLDGNGSYETDTGSTASASKGYAGPGDVTVGLRVTDDNGATATTTRTVTVQNRAPTASFTATPNPVPTGTQVNFDASGSSDPDGTVAKYEWDLDGNGSYETSTGSTPVASKAYASAGNVTVGLRVTDNEGGTGTTTRTVTAQNRAPQASFTASPNPAPTGTQVSFDASGSGDPDGTVAKYEWDLDGNGSYETSTGTTATTSKTYASAGNVTVGLRVTDNEGGTGTTTKTVTVQNRAPTASFTATPNPVPTGTQVSFNASGSSDPDGTIAKYEWDLDGNGSYETSTGTTATTSKTYASAGTVTVGLRVTDNNGATATTTRAITVQNRAPTASFTATPNPVPTGTQVSFNASGSSDPDGTISKYEWDLDGNGSYETSTGTTATTSKTYASAANVTVGLRVTDNEGANGTTTRSLVVQNRAPTASFTATPNPVPTGTQVSFNASGSSDPDGTVAKYEWDLDGNGSYETSTGTTATTSKTYASAANVTVGLRVTDNEGGTGTTTKTVTVQNRAPTASFTATPNPVPTGTQVNFDGSGSSDPDGTISKYEWDLDGNGSYETSTGSTATTSKSYATAGARTIGLRVTDNNGATATTTRAITVQNRAPTASFTATPNPVQAGVAVSFNASGSTDPDGTIAKYEWDLDGNGSYETSTGTTATTSKTYASAGTVTVGLRVTDNEAANGTTTRSLPVLISYNATVRATPNLSNYWRLGEASGTTLADSFGSNSATASGGVTLGAAGALVGDPNTAASFDGTNDAATASLNLSSTSQLTIEFWLKWNAYSNNDDLAFEFTLNSNLLNGGFAIDPNSSEPGGQFGVAIGRGSTRNNAFFARPSAGAWHHYALVLDTKAAAAQQILPYVDGKAVSFSKTSSGTGAGNFANSTLYFMSRSALSLFGAGTLDEVAIYKRALSAAEIAAHFAAKGS